MNQGKRITTLLILLAISSNAISSNTNSSNSCMTSQDAVERAQQMKKEVLDKLDDLAEALPPNTLDELIDELGGPDNVAEVIYCIDQLFFFFR